MRSSFILRTQLVFTVALVTVLGLADRTHAAVVWPGSTQWTALESGGNPIGDSDGPNPDTVDVRGDSSHAAGFVAYEPVEGNLFFRMRLDAMPSNLTSVWQIIIDSDTDSDIDWILQLDESGDNQMELNAASTGGPNFEDVVVSTSATWSGASSTYSRLGSTNDGYTFGSNADAYLDLAIPWSSFASATGLSTSDSFRVAITTSTTHSGINKDMPAALSSTSAVSSGWGDSFSAEDVEAVPEPGTWALFGLGLCGLAWARGRRRRHTMPHAIEPQRAPSRPDPPLPS